MFVRVCQVIVREARCDNYLACLKNDLLTVCRTAVGLKEMGVWERAFPAYMEIMIVSLWETQEAAQVFSIPGLDASIDRESGVIYVESSNKVYRFSSISSTLGAHSLVLNPFADTG